MVSIRKALAYSKRKVVPYTRKSKRRNKAYIKSFPSKKMVKFQMGNSEAHRNKKLPFELKMISTEDVQIRDYALEACRQFINKKLDKELAKQYFFQICIHPHHVQRENKMLTGAGADRMSSGMQLSFGRTMNLAAIVKKDTVIFKVATADKKSEEFARGIMKLIKSKLPCKTRFESEGNK